MDGYSIIAISGIDGNLKEFSTQIEPFLSVKKCVKVPYNRAMTFAQNIESIREMVLKVNQKYMVVGWSIGAVAAAFLANCANVFSVVMINPFFSRTEVLIRRNIECDEEVCICSTARQPVKYCIIAGVKDDKIPYTESIRIRDFYNLESKSLFLFNHAEHSLASFPSKKISQIINNIQL